jgi:hypothetical protein
MMNAVDEFQKLCAAANDACLTLGTATDCEPYFLATLNFVKKNPQHWADFKHLFVNMVSDPAAGPWELIAFCMRELRWPEVLTAVQRELESSNDFRVKTVMSKIAAVYTSDWEDGSVYRYYSKARQ